MQKAITENTSQNSKRGRPRKFLADSEAIFDALGLFVESKTRRNRMNIMYRQRALGVLREVDGIEWLLNVKKLEAGQAKLKNAIMTELGRIDNHQTIISFARALCQTKPTARQTVANIRRWRLGKDGAGTTKGLAKAMLSAYNDYLMRYPATTQTDISAALTLLMDSISN